MQNPSSYILPIILIVLAIFLRIKRSIGFQLYRPVSAFIRIAVCSIILIYMYVLAVQFHPETLLTSGAGIIAGLGFAYLGVRNIMFEQRKDELYYRTHVWVEVSILALFLARLAYRFYIIYSTLGNMPPEKMAAQLRYEKDPVTGVIISVFCTYYIAYFAYVLIQANKIKKKNNIQ